MDDSCKRIWLQEEIANRLHTVQAALYTITITENQDPQQAAYKEGFETALQCVARGFGLCLPSEERHLN